MTLVQFQVLLAVVEAKSFTKAAETLNMTQSAVSQTVSALESELGVTLVNRSRHGITPTQIGERAVSHVREILYRTRCMVQEAKASKGLEVGSIRIASVSTLSARLLPGIMGGFRKRFPGVDLVLFEGTQDEVSSWVDQSIVDVGLVILRGDSDMQAVPLAEERFMAYLPSSHALAGVGPLSLAQVASERLILSKADSGGILQRTFAKQDLTPKVQFEVQDTATILAMVQEGIGMAILPGMSIPTNLSGVSMSELTPHITRQVGICVRSLQTVSPAVAEFILHSQDFTRRQKTS